MKFITKQTNKKNNKFIYNIEGPKSTETIPSNSAKDELNSLLHLLTPEQLSAAKQKTTPNETKLANKLNSAENPKQETELAKAILEELKITDDPNQSSEKLAKATTVEGLPPKPLIPNESLKKQDSQKQSIIAKLKDFFNAGSETSNYLANLDDSTKKQGFNTNASEHFA